MAFLAGFVTPQDFGAAGNGTTDDTAAVQAAINYVNSLGGGVVFFPEGTYLVTPSGSPAVALSLTGTGSAGMQGVRLMGAGNQAATLKKNAAGTLLQMSGPSTSPSTGSTHTRYCSVESLGFNGNNYTGDVIQAYYADNLLFRDLYINGNADIVFDSAEFWDSRFYNCVFGGSGSTTANAATPNCYIRNSAAASGFGNSTGSTNAVMFHGCRWEAFLTGAVWIAQGPGNSAGPNTIVITDSKMETSQLNGGQHLLVDANSRAVYVNDLYCYSGGFYSGYSTAQDVVTWSAQDSTLQNVLISNGSSATVANGVTANSTVSGQNSVLRNVTGTYTTNPTGNHVAYGTGTGGFVFDNCNSSMAAATQYAANLLLVENASSGNAIATLVSGDSFKRWVANANGNMSWGPGSGAADNQLNRGSASTMSFSKNVELGSLTPLGDNGVGELQLANATTVPSTNPTGGAVGYARNGVPWTRDPNGVVSTMISPSEFSTSPTGCLAETFPRCLGSGATATQVIGATTGTVYMMGVWLPAGLTITNLNWVTGTTAAGTPTHWWLGIANSAGLQQAATADQLTGAIAASTLITKALTATYTTTATGLYYLLLSVTATTNPTATGLPAPISQMNLATPVLAGVSVTTQSAPGANGSTSYTAPASAGGIPYIYLT